MQAEEKGVAEALAISCEDLEDEQMDVSDDRSLDVVVRQMNSYGFAKGKLSGKGTSLGTKRDTATSAK